MNLAFLKIFLIIAFISLTNNLLAQGSLKNAEGMPSGNSGNTGGGIPSQRGGDTSFKHRDDSADSISIYYKYFDKNKTNFLDSNINDFYTRFSLPYYFNHLGNLGTAARSMLFNPILKVGFNAGFHQFDIYNYSLENTKLFQTTKPFTELVYLLGSNAEQTINVTHTQNKKDNLNFSLEYRFINSPGTLKNQNASVNNTRFTLQYQSPNKRYHLTTILIANKNAASENGGTINYKLLDSLSLNNPFELATRLGISSLIQRNLFNTAVYTGNTYTNSQFLVRQQYDLGQKDSIVTDTTVVKLFYPKLRLQYQISLQKNSYLFSDVYADSLKYATYFNYNLKGNNASTYDTITFKDSWRNLENELSIISFPDKKNASQFIKASATIQTLTGTFNDKLKNNYYNIFLGGEYKNRSKNKIWDIEANAQFYVNGLNAGDYNTYISLQKLLSKKIGTLQIGFQNVNKSPAFIFNPTSSFRITNRTNYAKENNTKIWANYFNKKLDILVTGEYYLISNYLYFDSAFKATQDATIFNLLHIAAEKKFKLRKNLYLYSEFHLQQTTANAPVNVPQFLTRQRIAFEGNFYSNLFLSTGLEIRYHSNYKATGYSPINGQFFYQNNYTTNNRPDINLFFNFRIKTFKAYIRAENLNTLFSPSGYKSYNYNIEQYPTQGVWIRIGVWWNFVN